MQMCGVLLLLFFWQHKYDYSVFSLIYVFIYVDKMRTKEFLTILLYFRNIVLSLGVGHCLQNVTILRQGQMMMIYCLSGLQWLVPYAGWYPILLMETMTK